MSDTHRFFLATDDASCDAIRTGLDAAWGHPSEDGTTKTCFQPAALLPHDKRGRPMLSVSASFCEYPAVKAMLPQLLASGDVVEMTRAEWVANMPRPSDGP